MGTGALIAVLGGAACDISPLGGGHHWPYHKVTGWVIHKLDLETSMSSVQRQKDMTLKDELLRSVGGEEQRSSSRRMKRRRQSRNDAHLWMCLVLKVKSSDIKDSIA